MLWQSTCTSAMEFVEFADLLNEIVVRLPSIRNHKLRMGEVKKFMDKHKGLSGDLLSRCQLLLEGSLPSDRKAEEKDTIIDDDPENTVT